MSGLTDWQKRRGQVNLPATKPKKKTTDKPSQGSKKKAE